MFYHRKLQALITENFKWICEDKKKWGSPGGVPMSRRAFYVGSVGCLYLLITYRFCQVPIIPIYYRIVQKGLDHGCDRFYVEPIS
jgi:hypothetical protein